ncbi:ATP-binding protein [Hymenobacter sp. 15J16-1T3B]|uniref:sensor histidine kinase n=1 Tax=Hymenobacter sp. 15J16-1T3B TaxID=2886941 RepID=UPI001D0FDA78|nr:sensor histidine kinase [Hymenobacter sp. 15J16-1T3B]MCC3160866.1 ATP-binding protein [Hymenobacter sp. 15J16-1T3B]
MSDKAFAVDARVILNLGRHSIKDHTTALVELVKNSYDADATVVDIEIIEDGIESYISIADNGIGMTEAQLSTNWLRIGYSEKVENKTTKKKRRKTGEKGIGRLSTDRLGACVQIISKIKGETQNGIEINWDDFDVVGKSINDIKIKTLKKPEISVPSGEGGGLISGTQIIIKKWRQSWTKENINVLYEELSALINPFVAANDFAIQLKTNIDDSYSKSRSVKPTISEAAEVEVKVYFDGKDSNIVFTIKDRYNKGEIVQLNSWSQIYSQQHENQFTSSDAPSCGPVEIDLYFYLNKAVTLDDGTKFTLSDLREFLQQNSGVRIYRDGVAVKPYGYASGQGDWLGLGERKARDPSGVSRASYKVSPNQLVGVVFVSRDKNQNIIDSVAREGLIENDAFNDMKDLINVGITVLEAHRFKLNKEVQRTEPKKIEKIDKLASIKDISNKLSDVKDSLSEIEQQAPQQLSLPLKNSIKTIDETITENEKAYGYILGENEKLLSENRVLKGLATLGISTAVFGHETQTSINLLALSVKNIKELFEGIPLNEQALSNQIAVAIKASKAVSAWGRFALTRVQVEKRRFAAKNIRKIIEDTLKDLKPSLDANNIALTIEADSIVSKVYPMDIESLIINLITNSYTACLRMKTNRAIKVTLLPEAVKKVDGYRISVMDSGPGIHPDFLDMIWEPLFSTKSNNNSLKVGTGLGLTIVKSIAEELHGHVDASNDSELGGASVKIWIPKTA